jgi:hypothetical protein
VWYGICRLDRIRADWIVGLNSVGGVSLHHALFVCFNLGIIYNHGSGVLDAGREDFRFGFVSWLRDQRLGMAIGLGLGLGLGYGWLCIGLQRDRMGWICVMNFQLFGCVSVSIFMDGWIDG